MSKDLVIAGVIVLSCAAVTAVAFVKPDDAGKPAVTDVAQVDPPRPSGPVPPIDPGPSTPTIPFGSDIEPFPPSQPPLAPITPGVGPGIDPIDPLTDPRGI